MTIETPKNQSTDSLAILLEEEEIEVDGVNRGKHGPGSINLKPGRTYTLPPKFKERWVTQTSKVEDEDKWPVAMHFQMQRLGFLRKDWKTVAPPKKPKHTTPTLKGQEYAAYTRYALQKDFQIQDESEDLLEEDLKKTIKRVFKRSPEEQRQFLRVRIADLKRLHARMQP